jgi:hypothetical protein
LAFAARAAGSTGFAGAEGLTAAEAELAAELAEEAAGFTSTRASEGFEGLDAEGLVVEGLDIVAIFPKFSRAAGTAGAEEVRAAEAGVPLVVGGVAMVFAPSVGAALSLVAGGRAAFLAHCPEGKASECRCFSALFGV